MIKFDDIRSLANKIHTDVNQFYDTHPFIFHLDMVANNAIKFMNESLDDDSKNAIIFGAYFHDAIEDAHLTYNDVLKLAKQFLPHHYAFIATEIVYACTNEKGRTRAERANDKYYDGIRRTMFASFIKLCDRLSNMTYSIENKSSMAEKYLSERQNFINKVNNNDESLLPLIQEINNL